MQFSVTDHFQNLYIKLSNGKKLNHIWEPIARYCMAIEEELKKEKRYEIENTKYFSFVNFPSNFDVPGQIHCLTDTTYYHTYFMSPRQFCSQYEIEQVLCVKEVKKSEKKIITLPYKSLLKNIPFRVYQLEDILTEIHFIKKYSEWINFKSSSHFLLIGRTPQNIVIGLTKNFKIYEKKWVTYFQEYSSNESIPLLEKEILSFSLDDFGILEN